MEKEAVQIMPGAHDISNLKSDMKRTLQDLSYLNRSVTGELGGIINKLPGTVKAEHLHTEVSQAKEIIKSIPDTGVRQFFQHLFLVPLQVELGRKRPDEIDINKRRELRKQLSEIRKKGGDPIEALKMMQEGLTKGSPRSQISPRGQRLYASVSDVLRKISTQILSKSHS